MKSTVSYDSIPDGLQRHTMGELKWVKKGNKDHNDVKPGGKND
jgi:hypothetical protein